MPDAVSRFSGVASLYDAVRPMPPAAVADVIGQWAGAADPDVVDLGAGTGLSTVIWAGRARQVIAVEPSAQMRAFALRRISAAGMTEPGRARTGFDMVDATAEETGLPGACADIVTASQAMHWFDPARALPEIARILRPGGVFAAYDCDWPPCIDWETDAAFAAVVHRASSLERQRGLRPAHAGKQGHGARLRGSGLFRHVREIAAGGREQGDAQRLIGIAHSSLAGIGTLLADGVGEDDLGLTRLRQVCARRLSEPRTWWWTYRIHLAVK
jgi:SAM-dependent methyltransferase